MSSALSSLSPRIHPARAARIARGPVAWLYGARHPAGPLGKVLRGLFVAALLTLCIVCYAATVVAVIALLVRAISECSAQDP